MGLLAVTSIVVKRFVSCVGVSAAVFGGTPPLEAALTFGRSTIMI